MFHFIFLSSFCHESIHHIIIFWKFFFQFAAPRSGLAAKHFIDVGAGVIDQDYRGNVGVVLFNFGEEDFKVNKGDRIAQLILERIYIPELEELQNLDNTARGSGGFGSTGWAQLWNAAHWQLWLKDCCWYCGITI